MVKYFFIAATLLFLSTDWLCGQSERYKGRFPVANYTNDDFYSPVQIHCAIQIDRGEILFGNNEKIIRFNGVNWSFIELEDPDSLLIEEKKHEKKVYDFFKSKDGTIYVARENSYSTVEYDTLGNLVYRPFFYDPDIKTTWRIVEADDGTVLFFSTKKVIAWDPKRKEANEQRTPRELSDGKINGCSVNDDGVFISVNYAQDDDIEDQYKKGAIFHFSKENKRFTDLKLVGGEGYSPKIIEAFIFNGKRYLLDGRKGIISYEKKQGEFEIKINKKHAFSHISNGVNDAYIYDNHLWLGTKKRGILIVDDKGEIVREFGIEEDVQDLNVLSMLFDKDYNLWLCLDNGISVVEFSSPVAFWKRSEGVEGAIESVSQHNGNIYLASRSKAILKSKERNYRLFFEEVGEIGEPSYGMKIVDTDYGKRKLIIGYSGIYELFSDSDSSKMIADGVYAWKLFSSPYNTNEIIVGGEGFVGRLTIDDSGWKYEDIEQLDGYVRSLISMGNQVYFSVTGEGIYTMNADYEVSPLEMSDNLLIRESNFALVDFNGDLYAGFNAGLVRLKDGVVDYASVKNKAVKGKRINVHRLFMHPEKEEMWGVFMITKKDDSEIKEIGYFTKEDDELVWNKVKNPMLEKGVLYDMLFRDNLFYFGSTLGLFALDMTRYEKVNENWEVYLNNVYLSDSLISYIPEKSAGFRAVPHGQPLRFNFSSTSFYNKGSVLFRTRLSGYTEEWSSYEKVDFKQYERLPHGKYTLYVQGKNYYDVESEVYSFTFEVLPPWYFTWWAYSIYVIVLIIIFVVSSKIAIYRVKQKNKRLEELVKERTNEIAEQNKQLEKQKNEIQSKTEDILDSIKYAKRIQDTILPSTERLDDMFSDHFVFYLPKDIVSGDFYWARKIDDKAIWSAIDCTGHGVPGALVSIVGNNGLLRSTNEFGLTQPAEILDKTRELVIESFKTQGDNDVRDGMDMALATLDLNSLELEFAGANNSCVIIREGDMFELKPDKQPIGDFDKSSPFTNHTFQLEKGDCVYLFSDGYVDQFGGPKGKKFKSRPFKNLLLEISELDMGKQKEVIVKHFDEWKGDVDQIDDVCVFGVRV